MKKYFLAAALLWLSGTITAQGTYYVDAYDEYGEDLREALTDIISVHSHLPYSSSNTDTWDVLKVSDRDPNNSSNVLLIYAGASVNGAQEYNGGNGWNREHVWPQSLGGFNTNAGVGTDIHNLKPADVGLNSLRSNLEYDDLGTSGSAVNYNGSATGCRYYSQGGVFEPRDDVKGDLARIILYMDLRYEGANGEPDLVAREALNSGGTTFAVMSTLLEWHEDDPVDSFEVNRNNVIHQMQGNRNPFIDYPSLVHYLYGDSTTYDWNPTVNIGLAEEDHLSLKVYPQPADGQIFVDFPTAGVYYIHDATGRMILSNKVVERTTGLKIATACWAPGLYTLRFGSRVELIAIE